jgi:hypothetical protein
MVTKNQVSKCVYCGYEWIARAPRNVNRLTFCCPKCRSDYIIPHGYRVSLSTLRNIPQIPMMKKDEPEKPIEPKVVIRKSRFEDII